ncbi:hypothetical protein Tco_0408885 [Tanacetum coccineum]
MKKISKPSLISDCVDILKQTNFFRAFTASSTIPAIYIQQFWDTICFDSKAGSYKCQLDEQWFNLTQDTLRDALQITPVDKNRAFSSPPTPDTLVDLSIMGVPKDCHTLVNVTSLMTCSTVHKLHHFHPRPESPLHLPTEEPVLGRLKFSAKGSKREVFGMTILNELINDVIRGADYLCDGLTGKVTKALRKTKANKQPIVSKTKAKKSKLAPAKPKEKKRKPVSESYEAQPLAKRAKAGKVAKKRTVKSSKQLVDEFVDEGVPAAKPSLEDIEEAILQKVLQESLTDAYPTQRGPLPPVKKSSAEQYIFQRRSYVPTETAGREDSTSLYARAGLYGSDTESDEEMPSVVRSGAQDEGQAGAEPRSLCMQAPGWIRPCVLAGPTLEHSDVEITEPSGQPQPEHMDEGFTASAYPDVQENLKLTVDEQDSIRHDESEDFDIDKAQEETKKKTPPPPPPSSSTPQGDQSTGNTAPSSSKTAASAEYSAWTTTDTRIKPSITLIPDDLYMDDETTADEQAVSSDDEVGRDHIPTVNLRQSWWKPLTEDRPATPEPAWTIPSSNMSMLTNNWASALKLTYAPLTGRIEIAQTGGYGGDI